ncbi:S-adenosyl-L-methionine-dependent methyltransferase [Boletus edulis BED1]|uniref:rRNA adenine N(6)-methyltransferase n=1 Tax=Boletus edulis BED1 TaxID=1328754 RepID=A0AAD4G7X8_BOLED|nr:S-adenosyl-L-methionine-dependent methyltransferase [Boletus edulis BED1]
MLSILPKRSFFTAARRCSAPGVPTFPTTASAQLVKHHACLRNSETAAQVAEAFVPAGTKDKVIIEAFPGPGVLTRALLQLPRERIRKIIVLEDSECFLDSLRPLPIVDPRVQVLPWDGYAWSTYHNLEAEGHLRDVEVSSWEEPDPPLSFIAHLPTSIYGEQLIAQLLRLVPDRGWLFRYGRVPMNYVMHDFVWERISANTSNPDKLKNRCKLSVIAEAVASFREVVPASILQPYEDHFWPPSIAAAEGRSKKNRQNRNMVAITMDPLLEQAIEKGLLDKWDYCLRKLFVLRSTPLKRAISHLAPGASTLLATLAQGSGHHSVDTSKRMRELSVQDWAALVQAFHAWPFAPDDLLITDSFSRDERL